MTLQKKTLVSKKPQPSIKAAATKIDTQKMITSKKIATRMVTAKKFDF